MARHDTLEPLRAVEREEPPPRTPPEIPPRPRVPAEPGPREWPQPDEPPLTPAAPPAPEPFAPPEVQPPLGQARWRIATRRSQSTGVSPPSEGARRP
jgi:hypothetical protein